MSQKYDEGIGDEEPAILKEAEEKSRNATRARAIKAKWSINKYDGHCKAKVVHGVCGRPVGPEEGFIKKINEEWVVYCMDCMSEVMLATP